MGIHNNSNKTKNPKPTLHAGVSPTEPSASQTSWISRFGKRDVGWLVLVLALVWRNFTTISSTRTATNGHGGAVTTSTSTTGTSSKQEEDKSIPSREECHVTTDTTNSPGIMTRSISPHCFSLAAFRIHTVPGLKASTCRKLIQSAERHDQWTGMSRFGTYQATRDVSLDSIGQYLDPEDVQDIEGLVNRIASFAEEHFMNKLPNIDGKTSNLVDMESFRYDQVMRLKGSPFVIRYDADEIPEVRLHKDNADVSFIVLLSDPDDFEGGGTVFQAIGEGKPILIDQGQALIFAGQLVHGAKPITKGRRYVLSGFTYFSEEYWKLKRLGTLDTMIRLD